MNFVDSLLPIFVCVVLPVAVVWIISSAKKHEMDRKTEVMLKAIENGQQVDPEMFKQVKEARSTKRALLEKLNGALVCFFIGLALLAVRLFGIEWTDGFVDAGRFGWGLAGALILMAVGIALFISYLVGKKMLAGEIRKEEQQQP